MDSKEKALVAARAAADKKGEDIIIQDVSALLKVTDYFVIVTGNSRPQIDAIQLLMPIYLSGSFRRLPDFALVLTPNPVHEIYEPETILPLNAVYKNARLIAKPDETWLNPEVIFATDSGTDDE